MRCTLIMFFLSHLFSGWIYCLHSDTTAHVQLSCCDRPSLCPSFVWHNVWVAWHTAHHQSQALFWRWPILPTFIFPWLLHLEGGDLAHFDWHSWVGSCNCNGYFQGIIESTYGMISALFGIILKCYRFTLLERPQYDYIFTFCSFLTCTKQYLYLVTVEVQIM